MSQDAVLVGLIFQLDRGQPCHEDRKEDIITLAAETIATFDYPSG